MPDLRRRTGPLDATVADHVRRLASAAERHDGVEALGEQTLLNLTDPAARVVHLMAVDEHPGDGKDSPPVTAYAQVDLTATQVDLTAADGEVAADGAGAAVAELVVAPERRREGLGSALLSAVGAEAEAAGARSVLVWAHGNLPAAQALAAHAGLAVRRELWRMSLELTDAGSPPDPSSPPDGGSPPDAGSPPEARRTPGPGSGRPPLPDPPDGVVVRPFVVGQDEEAWLEVNRRAFSWHPEQGRMTRADLVAREREPWFDPDDLLLAERDGRLLASTWMKVEPGSDTGELYVLGVDPDAQGTGLGRYLTAATLAHLGARGLRTAVLYTEASNTAAVRTYSAAGFRPSRVDVQYG